MKFLTQKNLFVALAGLVMTIFLASCSHCGPKDSATAPKAEAKADCCMTKKTASADAHDHANHDHKADHHHHGKDHKHDPAKKEDCCAVKPEGKQKDCCVTKNKDAKNDCCKTKKKS